MGNILDIVKEFWFIIAAGVAFAFGYGELKSKVNSNAKGLTDLEKRLIEQRKEDMQVHKRDRQENRELLSEIQRDIKMLLQRQIK
jgi:hypothetical protein